MRKIPKRNHLSEKGWKRLRESIVFAAEEIKAEGDVVE
jgi:hypothetical protein